MSTQGPKPGTSSGRVPRGTACLNCRRRKLKCDTVKPICGQCVRTNRQFDCEYTDGPTLSPTQVLEEDIARLEARIREIEHPDEIVQSVPLHDPHSPSVVSRFASAGPSVGGAVIRTEDPNLMLMPEFLAATAMSASTDLHMNIVQLLIGYFLPHSSHIGFFLNVSRFLQAAYIPDAESRSAQLSSALLDTVLLWGIRLSHNESLRIHEPEFLSRATQSMSTVLAHAPHNIVHVIQAEVLLSTYFFSMSRLLEGKYHCSAAVSLSLSCRLNKIRSAQVSPDIDYAQAFNMTPPVDAIDEGERINAFWSVFVLDKSWAVALGTPPFIYDDGSAGASIDTPWPLDFDSYEQNQLPSETRTWRTMQKFLDDPESTVASESRSCLALRAQAVAMLDRATRLASQWTISSSYCLPSCFCFTYFLSHTDVSPFYKSLPDPDIFYAELLRLDHQLEHFISTLPPLEHFIVTVDPNTARELLLVHTLTRVASMRLHHKFRNPADGQADSKSLTAAKAVVAAIENVNLAQLDYVNPILAMLWMGVCQVLQSELSSTRVEWNLPPQQRDEESASSMSQTFFGQSEGVTEREELFGMIQAIVTAMAPFRDSIPLMDFQVTQMQEPTHE